MLSDLSKVVRKVEELEFELKHSDSGDCTHNHYVVLFAENFKKYIKLTTYIRNNVTDLFVLLNSKIANF